MITFYNRNETDFSHNGLGVIDNYTINPVINQDLNGIFSLEFDYPISAPYSSELIQERIIRCPVPDMQDQLFRISEREATNGGTFHVVAYHIFYDLSQNFVEDTYIVNRNGQAALQQILNAAQFPHNFTATSNIGVINSARIVRKNIAEVLLDSDVVNSFRSRWGGEIIRDRFHIAMQSVVGSDNGVSIRDKKNLTGYRSNVDFGTVVTRIMPQGFDGLFIPEKYVDSPLIGNYLTPRIRVIKYENVKAEDFSNISDAYNLLRELAQKEYSENHIDRPNATYNIEFAPLQNVEEYRQFSALESISMGDVVRVIHEEDGLDISARMVGYRYNPLTGAYISITLGNFTPKFTDISRSLKRIETDVTQAQDSANFALKSANGKNTNYYGDETPESPRTGDLWFKPTSSSLLGGGATDTGALVGENGEKTEIWIYETRDEITRWFPLSTDLTQEEMRLELEEAKELVDVAVEKSEEAVEAGEKATKAADEAKAESVVALLTANIAFDTAVDAIVKIGVQFIVKEWFQGNIENGSDTDSKAHLRSGYIDVNVGEKAVRVLLQGGIHSLRQEPDGENYIAQFPDGESPLTASYHYFRASAYIDFVPIPRQMSEWYTTGKYPTYASIIPDLNARNFENANITESVILNSYTGQGDLLIVYRIPLGGRAVPKVIHWLGRKDVSDNAVFLLSNGEWSQIGMITESGENIIHEWELTESQRIGITSGNVHIAFFAIKQGAWAGVYNASNFPFTLNPNSAADKLVEHLSTETSANAVTVPQNAIKMRVSVSTTIPPTDYKGNIYAADSRADYRNSVYSAILQQTDLINLRVAKGDVINQINISTEGILIAGNRVHITGQTTIDSGIIGTAMIANAAITNAKIGSVDAGKINTGTLSADRIAAGSITSNKLTISDGYITNAMIANSTIQNAKIANLDAGKITTGTLSAARIGAGSITADKLASNAIQVGLEGWTNSIRISPSQIEWYNGNELQGRINSDGQFFYKGSRYVGLMGQSFKASDPNIVGLATYLNGTGDFILWGYRTGSSGTYASTLILDPQGKFEAGQAGIHLGAALWTHNHLFNTTGSRSVRLTDVSLTSGGTTIGTFPCWSGTTGRARIVIGTDHLYFVTNNVFSSCTTITTRISELITRVNQLITRLNSGWVVTATGTTSSYSGTGLTTMPTGLT